jgi:hypothetical protein
MGQDRVRGLDIDGAGCKLAAAAVRFDQAFEFDFDAFATTPCRTADGTNLIINADTPITVSPFIGSSRQFPEGIKTPCFASTDEESFAVRADTEINGGTAGLTVDADTLLANQQGLHLQDVVQGCMGSAPCLPDPGMCETEFGATKPYGPIYRLTRSNVGSGSDTLVHLCVCIDDWDPVGEVMVTLPYCTEPFA